MLGESMPLTVVSRKGCVCEVRDVPNFCVWEGCVFGVRVWP